MTHLSTPTSRRAAAVLFSAACAPALVAIPAGAASLPPGGAVLLTGDLPPSGTILHDRFIDFEIRDVVTGDTLFAGTVHDRVVSEGGALAFSKRIFDTLVDTPGELVGVTVSNYTGVYTDVDYDGTSALGTAPGLATRTGDGSVIAFSFAGNPIHETEESKWFFARTDAVEFSLNGQMTLTLATGESTTIEVATPILDTTPPIGEIEIPTPFQCVCSDGVTVSGTAYDPDGTYDNHFLEYRPIASNTWTLIGQSFTEVPPPGGPLFFWNTAGLPQGYYLLRLTVENLAGLSTSVVTIAWVDQQFDNFVYAGPADGQVLGGNVCPNGIINDHCTEEYYVQYSDGGPFSDVDPGMPIYAGPKINQTFAVWDSTTVADGAYSLLVKAADDCGNVASDVRDIIIDNTPPTAIITDPINCQCVDGVVQVFGTADDANLAGWVLQYTGGSANAWVTIASGTDPVINDLLGEWNTTDLISCPYVLRLLVSDSAIIDCNGAIHHHSEFLVSVNVGCEECPGDLNHDGTVNAADLAILLGAWGMCP